ncbi:unnamed protein product [Calypogeia fissa]
MPRAAPSPVLPLLVLSILGLVLMASTYWRFAREEHASTITSQSTARRTPSGPSLVIPIVLLAVFVQAFGIPHRQDHPSPLLALLESLLHNSSFPMFITIIVLLLFLMGLSVGANRPWQGQQRQYSRCYVYGNRYYCNQ